MSSSEFGQDGVQPGAPQPPADDFAQRASKAILLAATAFAVGLWCTFGLAVWLAVVLRLTVTLGAVAAFNAWRQMPMPDMRRLREIVEVWPMGLRAIVGMLSGEAVPHQVRQVHPWVPVQETLLALLLYVGMVAIPPLALGAVRGILKTIFG